MTSPSASDFTLRRLHGIFNIFKFPPAATPLLWPHLLPLSEPTTDIFSISVTPTELSILTSASLADIIPPIESFNAEGAHQLQRFSNSVSSETGFAAFKVDGTLDFALVGILAGITDILAKVRVSCFVVSTFDTDYVLVKSEKMPTAEGALKEAGYKFA
ncbi:hypothetical protein HDV05_006655 [Chytridiales sp. JEL 0842]|nr:hypothetical protein HDV05_006655 [Chytridiales sp. JEL 0842]